VTALTLDASVIVKWFHPTPREADLVAAEAILQGYVEGRVALYQPPHWRAEVAAVLRRLSGPRIGEDVRDLCLLDVETVDTLESYVRATNMARALSQHLFDTLYHSVALEIPGCRLVTADNRYFSRAQRTGGIEYLSDYRG
jgi:predicted nucleic acid-binding protein